MSARKRSAAPLVIATLVGLIAGAAGSKAATSALEKRGILSRPEMIASPPPHHKPALPPPATRPPPPSPPPPLSLVDRATRGDTTSVRQLTEKPPGERTAEETLALADAQAVDKRAQLAELARKIKLLPQFGRASSTAKIVAQFVQDRQVSTDALRMLAALPNEIGPDLLYSIWTGAREQDDLSKW
ncbi:MAG TPA: hypothetical protein VGJ84_04855, partial [Polyangiaceae bacterium]